jgi:rod shape-determining protein MreC
VRPLSPSGPSRRRSRYYVLLVVTLAAVTLITLDARGVVAISGAREGAIDLFSPVRGAARWVTTPVRNAWNGITGYEDLQAENEQLRSDLEELRGERWKDQDAAEELARLEEQLGITYLQGLDTQIARVTTGPYSNFTDHTLQLDRGRDAGLAVGMPVVQRDGLVGRIVRVTDSRSVVQLITDPDMWIGIRLSRSGVIGKGHGGGDDSTFIGEVSLDTGAPVEERELVVTGGIERSIMPPGNQIPIGTVAKVTPDEAARVQTLQIDYSVDFSELDVVQVVKWVPDS